MIPRPKGEGWSQSGTLQTGVAGEVSLQANFVQRFGAAGPFTVQLGVLPPLAGFPPGIVTAAEIEWSVQGNTVRRIVDLVNGLSISGFAEACRVVIRNVASVAPPGDPFVVSVQLTPGTRPSEQRPPTLTTGRLVAAAGFTDVAVPVEAGAISVFVTMGTDPPSVLTSADIQVQHRNTVGPLKAYDPRDYGWVPIDPRASIVRLVNTTATPVIASVIFGIDG